MAGRLKRMIENGGFEVLKVERKAESVTFTESQNSSQNIYLVFQLISKGVLAQRAIFGGRDVLRKQTILLGVFWLDSSNQKLEPTLLYFSVAWNDGIHVGRCG